MKTLTVLIECPDERTAELFHELTTDLPLGALISADESNLTVRLRDLETRS